MTKKWHTKTWKMKVKSESENWEGAMAGIADPGGFADDIFSSGDYASLFVYMFRRFGIPEWGSDPYKEIACWFLTTPDPAVVLIVSPRPSGLRYSFGYEVNRSVYSYQSHDEVEAIRSKIEPFLKEAMKDLMTPTNVRDTYINAMGRVKDEDIGRSTCTYFRWAGFGVTADYYRKFKKVK